MLVALDLGEYAEIVLEHAIDLAARHSAPDLHFLHIHDGDDAALEVAKARLAALVLPAFDRLDCSDWRIRLHVRRGKVHAVIAELAGELAAQLLVIGRFGTHRSHRRIGATASRIVELAPCPTLVVGLSGSSEALPQCPDCVDVRAESDGEIWFCAAHAGDRTRLSALVVPGTGAEHALLW